MKPNNEFAWQHWLKPLGVPLAVSLAEWEWSRNRSAGKALAMAAGALAVTYAVSQLDYRMQQKGLEWPRLGGFLDQP